MVDVLQYFLPHVLALMILEVFSEHPGLPVDSLRALTRGSCSAAFRLMRGSCAACATASQPQTQLVVSTPLRRQLCFWGVRADAIDNTLAVVVECSGEHGGVDWSEFGPICPASSSTYAAFL